jgi:hypothetical protein
MPLKSTTGELSPRSELPGSELPAFELDKSGATLPLPVTPGDLEKLARWIPEKEMSLLVEICERARRDPELLRPALLLCSAYGKSVARMLDQDPFPTVTRNLADQLQQLRERDGL